MADPEVSLIERAAHGDNAALTALLEQYGPPLRAGLGRQIPRRWRSLLSEDDVMQQTYADAIRYITTFVPRGVDAFPRWLTTLRNNNLRDAIAGLEADRRGGRVRRLQPNAADGSYVVLLEALAVTTTTPSRSASREESKALLVSALGQLPEAYTRVVQLYDLEGRTVAEVAATLERSPGAVFMLRARAHLRLSEILGSGSDYLTAL